MMNKISEKDGKNNKIYYSQGVKIVKESNPKESIFINRDECPYETTLSLKRIATFLMLYMTQYMTDFHAYAPCMASFITFIDRQITSFHVGTNHISAYYT